MATLQVMPNDNALKSVRLLIVEDEYILALNLQESLESLGYTIVDIADSAEAAIAIVIEQRPNLVLMDIRLRGEMDGIQAAEQIWKQFQIPIIFVTGHSDKSTVERATLTFPFGYILKPVREKELYVAIQTALNCFEREQFFSTVLQGMADGVIVTDTRLHIKFFNRVAECLTGWKLSETREQLVTNVIQFVDELDGHSIENPMLSALQQNATVYLNDHTLLITKSGTTLPVADSATPLQNQDGEITGVVLVFRDDTQRRLLEERNLAMERTQQVEIQLQELQRLNDLKDDFLATTSHELRTPLSNIKLAIRMLEVILNQKGIFNLEGAAKAESITRYLTVLRDQCDQELSMVNDLLDMRSIEAGAYPLDPAPIQLQDWLPYITVGFQDRVKLQQQKLQVSVPSGLPPFISDLSSLTRIMSELLNNACKYTPANEKIEVVVQLISLEQHAPTETQSGISPASAERVQIIVRNSGVEIAPEQLAKIFEPFYRIPSNDPWKHGGTGLGLALVKKIVTYIQGEIKVSSNQGWVIFTLQLPLALAS